LRVHFNKYQGTGNDFIIIDNRHKSLTFGKKKIVKLCDRRLGIGSDGLILIENDEKAEFYMDFYNPDASQSFCGNGSRCAVAFAIQMGWVGENCEFRAIDGFHKAKRNGESIHISLADVIAYEKRGEDYIINTGSPHYIRMVENANDIMIIKEARDIRYNESFRKDGINVNFVETISFKKESPCIKMRTYERGVEDETLSCGTGVTAAAIAMSIEQDWNESVNVSTKGGELQVTFEKEKDHFSNIWLSGPAIKVFDGSIDVEG